MVGFRYSIGKMFLKDIPEIIIVTKIFPPMN